MKRIVYGILLTAIMLFSSCKKECEMFYSGPNCSETRNLYINQYIGTLVGAGSSNSVTVNVSTTGTSPQLLWIDGRTAELTNNTEFSFLNSYGPSGSGYTFNGYGSFSGKTLTYVCKTYINGNFAYSQTFTGSSQ